MNKLEYYLKDNPLTPDPNDFYGAVQHGTPVDDQELEEMIMYRSTGMARSDVKRFMEEYKIAIYYFLTSGRSINTDLFNASYSISGVFVDEEDRFEPSRHSLNLNLKPGAAIQGITEQMGMVKITAPAVLPVASSFIDTESGSKNQQLTPGAPAKLSGKKLKFDAEDPLQGVYFINESGNKSFKVDKYVECNPSKLIFKVPSGMAKGNYTLEVRKGADKVGKLAATLQVV